MSSHYELEKAAWAGNQRIRKESENYSDYCIKNLLDIFFKSSFLYLVILGTVSKEKLLYPKQKKHKRWNLASNDVTQKFSGLAENQQIYGIAIGGLMGRKSL